MQSVPEVPAGFVPLTDPEGVHDLNIVPADQLKSGAVVTYRGSHEWKSASGQPHRAHAFEDENGLFGIWASAQLDRLLKQVRPGARLFVRYEGLVEHPSLPGRSTHRWTVAPAAADLPATPRTAA
ncbi:MAG: hypothetical protein IT352_18895 [Gemmatimonadales bacterium]|nr:hypothetical protein [Gemmatimonadales bacterium]